MTDTRNPLHAGGCQCGAIYLSCGAHQAAPCVIAERHKVFAAYLAPFARAPRPRFCRGERHAPAPSVGPPAVGQREAAAVPRNVDGLAWDAYGGGGGPAEAPAASGRGRLIGTRSHR